MKLTKRQIQKLKASLKRANKAEQIFANEMQDLTSIITQITGVEGNVDYLSGDGFGFTPLSNNDTHIIIEKLIDIAEDGKEITEEVILDNLTI